MEDATTTMSETAPERLLAIAIMVSGHGRGTNMMALLQSSASGGIHGERVHQAVLESGMKVSGCTVHFVDEQYDTGPIIVQTAVPVLDDDTPATLAARILPEEHRAYVRAVQLFATGRLRIEGRRVV